MTETDDMIEEIGNINSGRVVNLPDIWPDSIEDVAYIGDRRSPYDEGEHYKKALILLRRDIQPDDLRRFHDVESILIIDTLIDDRLSLNHYHMLEELRIIDIQFGDTLPDFGPIQRIHAVTKNRDENDPEGTVFFEKLLASTSRTGMEMSIKLPWSGNRIVNGWLGRALHFFQDSDTLEDVTFRLSNCPNLGLVCFCCYNAHFVDAFISNLPQLKILRAQGLKHLEIEDDMIPLNYLRLDGEQKKNGTIVGLENCASLHLLQLKGYNLSDLRTVSSNSEMKTIDVGFSSLSSLVGVEYLHNLENLIIRRTPLAREIRRKLRGIEEGKPGEEDALRGLLCQLNLEKVRITTGMGWVDERLVEFSSRASN